MRHGLSRRLLMGAAGTLPLLTGRAWSQQLTTPYRVGAFNVEPLFDGPFPLMPEMIPGADSEEGRALLRQAGLPPSGPSPEPVNAFLIRRGERIWLLDAGCGTLYGPDLGKALALLPGKGVVPERLETIWLTHIHGDHAGGLLTPDGGARFPSAEVVVQEAEAAFWSDAGERSRADTVTGSFFDAALAVLKAYKGRVRLISGASELTPGVSTLPLPGHTPGYMGVLLEDAGERLLIWGDVVHSRILQMPHPEWTVVFDADKVQAEATRRRILDMAAADRLPVTGMHLATRGVIERRGSGYVLVT